MTREAGEGETGGKQKPDFLSGPGRPSRADAQRCPPAAAKNSSPPPPLMEKASPERQQDEEKRTRKRSCHYLHCSASRGVVPRHPRRDRGRGGRGVGGGGCSALLCSWHCLRWSESVDSGVSSGAKEPSRQSGMPQVPDDASIMDEAAAFPLAGRKGAPESTGSGGKDVFQLFFFFQLLDVAYLLNSCELVHSCALELQTRCSRLS